MGNSKILIYDGSFNGFLTAIFVAFEEKVHVLDIQKNSIGQNALFSDTETIVTRIDKAKRVWNGIQAKSNSAIKNIYFAYLSEYEGIEQLLYHYILKMFAPNTSDDINTSDGIIVKIRQLAKNVAHSKERAESFIGFQLTQDEVYFATIRPDFDILPLISKRYRARFTDQPWIIYDLKRKYGLYYDLRSVEIISLDLGRIFEKESFRAGSLAKNGDNTDDTWNENIKNITIGPYINKKLHALLETRRYGTYAS